MKFKERLVRAFCRHPELKFIPATGAELLDDGGNVEVGLLARCPTCKRTWTGEVRAGCPEAYGHPSSSRVVIPAAPRFKMGSSPTQPKDPTPPELELIRRLAFKSAATVFGMSLLLLGAYLLTYLLIPNQANLRGILFLGGCALFAMFLTSVRKV